jgi:hypothetical protein
MQRSHIKESEFAGVTQHIREALQPPKLFNFITV